MSDKTVLTSDEIRELKCELTRVNAQLFPSEAHIAMESAVICIEQLERAVLAASEDRRDAELARLRQAIEITLRESAHLADGDDCTLIHLKRAIAAAGNKVEGK